MKHEQEGIFVIKFKNYNNTGYERYLSKYVLPTLSVDDAEWFETRTAAYKRMLQEGLDKKCFIEEID